jgi:hypothetical protein
MSGNQCEIVFQRSGRQETINDGQYYSAITGGGG